MKNRIQVWADGAPHEICVIIGEDEPIVRREDFDTNNIGEYQSLITALESIKSYEKYIIYMDSQLVVYQMDGRYKTKQRHLKLLKIECQNIIKERGLDVIITWIPRELNLAGKYLERQKKDKAHRSK